MAPLRALVFLPDGPGGGVPARVRVDAGSVEFELDAPESGGHLAAPKVEGAGPEATSARLVAPADIALRRVGFDAAGVELAWSDPRGRLAAHVLDRADAEALLVALASTPLAGRVEALRAASSARTAASRRVWRVFAAVALVVLVGVGALLANLGVLAATLAARVPVEHERALGEQVFAQLRPGLELLDAGPEVERVRALGALLAEGARHRFDFHVARDAAVNAFALPGGIVVVHTGLIEAARRPEELAGVLAHEIGHVEERHALSGVLRSLGLSTALGVLLGDLGATAAADAARHLAELSFSREAEREADAFAFDRLVARDIDPTGLAEFFGRLDDGAPTALFRTHPLSKEREARLVEARARLGDRTFPPLEPRLAPRPRASP